MLHHPSIVTGLVEYNDRLATVGTDGTFRLWNRSGLALGGEQKDWMQASTDGRAMVAAAGIDHALGVWQLDAQGSLAPLPALPHSSDTAPAASLLADGSGLVGGDSEGHLLVWPRHGDSFGNPQVVDAVNGVPLGLIVASPDGSSLAALTPARSTVAYFRKDGPSYRKVADLPIGGPQAAAFTRDGALLAVAGVGNEVKLWSLGDGAPREQGRIGELPDVGTAMAFAADSRELVLGTDTGTVRRWDLTDPASPRTLSPLVGPQAAIYGLDISSDGTTVAAGSGDERLWMWRRAGDGRVWASLDSGMGRVNDVRFLDDGARLIGVGAAGQSRVWTVDELAARRSLCARVGDSLTGEEWQRDLPGLPPRVLC